MTQYCTFTIDDMTFGVEVARVQEAIRFQEMTAVPLSRAEVRGLINLRGQIVTALELRRRLGLPDAPEGSTPMNVVVRTPDGAVSLLVDRIGDVVDVDADSFEAVPDTVVGIGRELLLGAHKLPGGLLLVLDTDAAVAVLPRSA